MMDNIMRYRMIDKYRLSSRLHLYGSDFQLIMTLRRARIIFLLLSLCCFFTILFAVESKPNEILGPESGYLDLRWRPDDQVMPIKWEGRFNPDKFDFAIGELLTVHVKIWIDKESRGYKPGRTYYIKSKYAEGRQLFSFVPQLGWTVIKSDIDTLEIMTDDRILEGDITMQLLRLNGKPQVKISDSGVFMTIVPPDTTSTKWGTHSAPLCVDFKTYRIFQPEVSPDDRRLESEYGDFIYDLEDVINVYGDVFLEKSKGPFNSNEHIKVQRDDTYISPTPTFKTNLSYT